jgi:hypothetical protein
LAGTVSAEPAQLRCDGVLGNSGEQGATLVRFAARRARDQRDGLGLACDRFGTLWDRAGIGQLNRYALDGRLLATVALPPTPPTHLDTACLVDDTLLMFLKEELWTLDVAAETPAPKKRGLALRTMARTAVGGRILVVLRDEPPRLAFYSPSNDTTEPLPWPPVGEGLPGLAVTPDGNPLALDPKTKDVRELVGQEWRKRGRFAEGVPQTVDGFYWVGQWHGTVKRFNTDFAPDPGVVLGGASGSFIGHLEGNYEVSSPTAVAAAGPSVYALGGMGCVAHLAAWDKATRQLTLVRRIGALHGIGGHLALDATGRVRTPAGIWNWNDGPTTPVRLSTGLNGNGQVAVFDNGVFFSSSFVYGTMPAVAWGAFDAEASSASERNKPNAQLPGNVRGCVALRGDKARRTLRLTADGQMVETRHDPSGKPAEALTTGKLLATPPIVEPTSLACLSDGRVLAAADGCILALDRTEKPGDWREQRRWNAVGDLRFGSAVTIASDGRGVWISDTANHRVLCVDEALTSVIATFGGARGDDLAHCDSPTAISANGRRAVVYDEGNQRLLKLMLP